jgi:hypothetical protein
VWWASSVKSWLSLEVKDYDEKGIFRAYHPFKSKTKNNLIFVVVPNIGLVLTWLISDENKAAFTAACFCMNV